MKNRAFTTLLVILMVTALMLGIAGCGNKADETQAPAETAAQQLATASGQAGELASFTMSAVAWSSSNGATITLSAVPESYQDGQSAIFVARLDEEEADRVTCTWDGSAYTAEMDLNAADGYFYYCILVAADGTESEIGLNTADQITSAELISLETALNAYCTMTLSESKADGDQLTIIDGSYQVQLPRITRTGEAVSFTGVSLILKSGEDEIVRQDLESPAEISGLFYQASLSGTSFTIPEMEDDQQLILLLEITLSDGQVLTTTGGNWHYAGGALLGVVG